MEVKNFTEEVVTRRLRELLAKRDDICDCETCFLDMVALALSTLPCRPYVTKEGAIYRELESIDDGFKLEVVEKCLLAISKVSASPRHEINGEKKWRNEDGTRETRIRSGKKEQLCSNYNGWRP